MSAQLPARSAGNCVAAVSLCFLSFLIDCFVPLGVAVPVLYVGVIWFSLPWCQPRLLMILTGMCTFFCLLAVAFSPAVRGLPLWAVMLNRSLATLAVWLTAIRGLYLTQRERVATVEGTALKAALRNEASDLAELTARLVTQNAEQQEIEKELLTSRRRLRDILNNTDAVVYLKGLDGRYLFVNTQFEQLFGHTLEEMENKTDFDVFPKAAALKFRENDEQVLKAGKLIRFEETAPHDDGDHYYISLKFPLRDEDHEIYAVAGISTDLTDLVTTQKDRDEIRRRMELILNSVAEGIYGLDLNGNTTFMNPAAAGMLGYTEAEVAGQRQHDLSHHTREDGTPHPVEDCPIYQAFQAGRTQQVDEDVFWRKDGTSFPVEYVSRPMLEENQVVGAVVTFRDITLRRQRVNAEQQLTNARAIQKFLTPSCGPDLAGFDIAADSVAAEYNCADYLDFIRRSNGRTVFAVGDVTGHGLGPALLMLGARSYLRAKLTESTNIAEVFDQLNPLVAADMPPGKYISLFAGELDPETRRFSYTGAGHEACVLRADGREEILESSGRAMGLFKELPPFQEQEIQLESGDILVIPTDGVLEAHDGVKPQFGWKETLNLLRKHRNTKTAAELVKMLYEEVRAYIAPRVQTDDITMLLVKVE